MSEQQPRYAFTSDDLSVYERVNPHDLPDYDEVNSRYVIDPGAPGDVDGD